MHEQRGGWVVVVAGTALTVLVTVGDAPGWGVARGLVAATVAAIVAVGLGTSRRWGPVAAIGFGAVALAVGVGFGPHLVKAGFGLRGTGAAVAVVSGVVLVGVGVVLATHRRGWPARLGAAAATLVACFLIVSVVGPSVAVVNVAPSGPPARTVADVGLDAERVTITASDGVRLAAWWVPGDGAAVVLRHGAGSTHEGVLDEAVVLARRGYGVLLMDARGHGRSTGRAMDLGWWGEADITAALDHLERRDDVDMARVALLGTSMGGEEALAAAGDPRVAAVVAEGATARSSADKAWLSEAYGWRGALQERIEQLQQQLTGALTGAPDPEPLRDAIAAATAPVLLIAAGRVEDEQHAAAWLASVAPDRVLVWTVEGAAHTDGLATDPTGWERRVVDLLDRALPRASDRRADG